MSDSDEEERGLLSPSKAPLFQNPEHSLLSEDDAGNDFDDHGEPAKGIWKWKGAKAREYRRILDLAAPLCLSYFAVNISMFFEKKNIHKTDFS